MSNEARRGFLNQPLTQLLLRSVVWGMAWGACAGAVEAVWHLHTWSLATSIAVASGFYVRSVAYGLVFFGLSTPLLVASTLVLGRTQLPADSAGGGRSRILGGLACGTLALYGGVCWRVVYHINTSWKDPALWGGMLAILVCAAAVGLGTAAGTRGLARRFPRLGLVPIPLALLLYLAVPLATGDGDRSQSPTRVLLITLDTFRADRLGALGGRPTPTLDALADRGVLFQQAVAQAPITCPAHLSILSGTPPSEHGVFANGTAIPTDLPLLQESFQAAGVPTAGFVAGYPVTARFGFDRGFDVFDDDFGDALGDHRLAVRRLLDQAVYSVGAPRERRADAVLERALPWLDRHAEEGFFCWLHFFDPHGPYDAPEPFRGSLAGPLPQPTTGPEMPPFWPPAMRAVADPAYWSQRYDEEIAYLDDQLAQLMSTLSERGVLEDTLIVVVADHGESLDEHDYYFDHGLHLYDASLRIPMIVAGPGVPSAKVPCQVRGMDLAPTVLDLVKLEVPDTMLGERLEPLWQRGCPDETLRLSEAATVEPPWVEDPGAELSLRVDGTLHYKLIRHRRGEDELYELNNDAGETVDLIGQRAEVEDWMNRGLDRIAEGMPPVAPKLTADVEAQLRALGYITDGPRPDEPVEPQADDDSAGAD